jgi:hypothetical protein
MDRHGLCRSFGRTFREFLPASFSCYPLPYIGRTIVDLYFLDLALCEKTDRVNIHKGYFLEI